MASMLGMMKETPRIILFSTRALQDLPTNNLTMIVDHLLLLHSKSQSTTMLGMTHLLGAGIQHGNHLHLGQNPKLGGRYTDISLIYTSYFVGTLYIHISLSFVLLILFLLSKTQKDQKYFSCFSFV